MGKVANQIQKIQTKENISLKEVFEKYPHLVELLHQEALESSDIKEQSKLDEKQMKLLLG